MVDRSLGRALADPLRARLGRIARLPVARWLWRLRAWQAAGIALALLLASGAAAVYYGPATLGATPPLQTAFLYDRDGRILGQITAEENRVVVPLSEIPSFVQDAFVAVEDERFWSHIGIDPLAIGRALFANARGDREGASTITQQLVKNSTVGGRRTLWRKAGESVTAIRLERRYPKKQILEAYLNSIYLGGGAYGVEAASRLYFGHGVDTASLAEAALLAGITAAPQRFSPRVDRDRALARRNYALGRMREQGLITEAQREGAVAERIRLAKRRRTPARSPLFADWVRGEILRRLGEDVLYRGGLRVRTSLDLDVQQAAETAVAEILDRPGDPAAAVVAMEVATGQVRAMVGGRSPKPGDFNLATRARRQAGSAFKPFVLAAALDDGFDLTRSYRAPGFIRLRFDSGEVWRVRNYDGRGYGRLSLRSATAYSVNTVYAQLIRDVGPERVVEVARGLGITSPLSAVPSLALGTSGVTPLEMAAAYASIANDGRALSPSGIDSVRDSTGSLLYSGDERKARRGLPAAVAEDVQEALRSVVSRGTGTTVRMRGLDDLAGKTGTTEDHRDAWFVGFSSGYVIAVWVGYPSNAPMNRVHGIRVTGGSFPARIFKRVLASILEQEGSARDHNRGPATRRGGPAPSPGEPSPGASGLPSEQPSPEPTTSEPPRRCPLIICPSP